MSASELVVISESPPNAGTRLDHLDGNPLGVGHVYLRNNFQPPATPPDHFEVDIDGVGVAMSSSRLAEIPQVEYDMVLECAGNGRIFMDPIPDGTPWDYGGASPVIFSGPRLLDVIGPVPAEAVDLVFTGADSGHVDPEGTIQYQFSIGRDLWDRTILATHLDRKPLTLSHGGPVRLIVPGEYAMKSVKWLTRIATTTKPFTGHFVNKYRYFGDTIEPEGTGVGAIAVRSLISRPRDGEDLRVGRYEVRGAAWSGAAPISRVEVSVDHRPWAEAKMAPTRDEYSAVPWTFSFEFSTGRHEVTVRAHDDDGHSQPLAPRWNRNGYANNGVHSVSFEVG
ncbi:MAG TPA: molybdopterin-dependent oxidoreductase [Acidimicrobiia bacterium]